MVHEVAVYLIIDVIAIKEEIPRVFHPIRDDFTLVVKGIGIVDVTFFGFKSGTITHDISINERIIDDIVEFVDVIGLGWVNVISDGGSFSLRFHRVVHFGIEIAYVVEVTHHLGGRIVGSSHIVIYGCPAESFVHPCPKLAVGFLLRLIVNPGGHVGLEGVFIGFESNIRRQPRLADFGLFLLDDDAVFLHQVFPFRDKLVDVARRHDNGYEQKEDDMEPFA